MVTPPAEVPCMPSLVEKLRIHGSSQACSTTMAPTPDERM
jgi:hypothetical protein